MLRDGGDDIRPIGHLSRACSSRDISNETVAPSRFRLDMIAVGSQHFAFERLNRAVERGIELFDFDVFEL